MLSVRFHREHVKNGGRNERTESASDGTGLSVLAWAFGKSARIFRQLRFTNSAYITELFTASLTITYNVQRDLLHYLYNTKRPFYENTFEKFLLSLYSYTNYLILHNL